MPMHSACEENFSLKKEEEEKKNEGKKGNLYFVTRFFSVE